MSYPCFVLEGGILANAPIFRCLFRGGEKVSRSKKTEQSRLGQKCTRIPDSVLLLFQTVTRIRSRYQSCCLLWLLAAAFLGIKPAPKGAVSRIQCKSPSLTKYLQDRATTKETPSGARQGAAFDFIPSLCYTTY